jgi:hypothetical protein
MACNARAPAYTCEDVRRLIAEKGKSPPSPSRSSRAFPSAKSGKSAGPVKSNLSQLETTNASQNSCGGTFLAVCHQRSSRLSRLDLGIRGPHGDRKRRLSGQMAALPSLTTHQARFDISGGVQTSAAFNAQTKYIRITARCSAR